MNINELLPIGSVVLLNGGKKRLMVYGVKQTNTETGVEYDYIGVIYPEGNIGNTGHFFFNASDIEKVFFTGFSDPERDVFLAKLEEFYRQK